MTYGGPRSVVTPLVSPHVYENTSQQRQEVSVSGGTVLQIEMSRDGSTFDPIGAVSVLNPHDRLRVTYLLPPTIAVYPL